MVAYCTIYSMNINKYSKVVVRGEVFFFDMIMTVALINTGLCTVSV